MNTGELRTGVIICTCQHCSSSSLNLEALRPPSREGVTQGSYLWSEVCEDPTRVTDFAKRNGLQGLVIAACGSPQHIKSFKSACKQAEIGPLTAECVPLKEFYGILDDVTVAEELARQALAVNTAKTANAYLAKETAQRFVGSRVQVSRRDFLHSFQEMLLEYSNVPVIQQEICSRYSKSCKHCVEACQFGAVRKDGQRTIIDPQVCVECGACASACPVGALQSPALSDQQVAGMIEAATFEGITVPKRVLMATCDRGLALLATEMAEGRLSNPGFIFVTVPCVVSLSWAHLILFAASGISLVTLCPDAACERVKGLVYTRKAMTLANELVGSLGADDVLLDVIEDERPDQFASILTRTYERVPRFVPRATVGMEKRRDLLRSALRLLVSRASRTRKEEFRGEGSQFFDILIDGYRCTLCPACAFACPERAIELKEDEGLRLLSFNPSKCVGCEACAHACPEKAITVETAFNARLIVKEAWVVKAEEQMARCKKCGLLLVPRKTIERVTLLLQAPGFEKIVSQAGLCQNCKQAFCFYPLINKNVANGSNAPTATKSFANSLRDSSGIGGKSGRILL